MPVVALAIFIIITDDQGTINISAMKTVFKAVGPFVARIRQLPDRHFDYFTVRIGMFMFEK
jgi:hypothetical protein